MQLAKYLTIWWRAKNILRLIYNLLIAIDLKMKLIAKLEYVLEIFIWKPLQSCFDYFLNLHRSFYPFEYFFLAIFSRDHFSDTHTIESVFK